MLWRVLDAVVDVARSTDRRGALELGRTARYQLAAARGAGWSDTLEEVDAWLAERE